LAWLESIEHDKNWQVYSEAVAADPLGYSKACGAKLPRRRRRRVSLVTAKRQAEKAGLTVAAATFGAEGVTLQFGDPAKQTNNNDNPWDQVFDHDDQKD